MRPLTDDRGFTLTELMIALGLLLVVLAAAFAGLQVVFKASKVGDIQAVIGREMSAPLTYFEEIAAQNVQLEAPTPYSVQLITDRNNDNIRERHIISANTDGKLVDQVWLINNSGVNTSLQHTYVWSRNNANRAAGIPLFHYYASATTTSSAVELTNMLDVPRRAATLRVDVVVRYEGKELRDSREILFRNR